MLCVWLVVSFVAVVSSHTPLARRSSFMRSEELELPKEAEIREADMERERLDRLNNIGEAEEVKVPDEPQLEAETALPKEAEDGEADQERQRLDRLENVGEAEAEVPRRRATERELPKEAAAGEEPELDAEEMGPPEEETPEEEVNEVYKRPLEADEDGEEPGGRGEEYETRREAKAEMSSKLVGALGSAEADDVPDTLPTSFTDLDRTESRTAAALGRLQRQYLDTVRMGLLGGLNHAAFTDEGRGSTTDPIVRNECLARDWTDGGVTLDICIAKWDASERLKRVENLYKLVRNNGVQGDLVECGVWRGGVTVYMKALLRAYEDEGNRKVWVSDSFNGVPNARRQLEDQKRAGMADASEWAAQADREQWGGTVKELAPDGKHLKHKNFLTVEQQLVKDNFVRFGLLDEGVEFLPGWFNESLPEAGSKGLSKISILRVDGDLYSSTMDVLENLYPLVAPGGYVILDDYALPQSREATLNFFEKQGLDVEIIKTDRLTPERLPKEGEEINHCGYFQKPF